MSLAYIFGAVIIVSFSAGFLAGHIGANSAIKYERAGRVQAEEQRDGAQKRVSELLDELYAGEKDERKQYK